MLKASTWHQVEHLQDKDKGYPNNALGRLETSLVAFIYFVGEPIADHFLEPVSHGRCKVYVYYLKST
jgi:hypothetical protein